MLRNPFRQRLALHELEHQCRDAIHLLEAVDRADVRVIERRQHPRFALEAREAFGMAREEPRQDFDRNVPTEPLIVSAIDFAHATDAQWRADRIGSEPSADEWPLASDVRSPERWRLQKAQERLDLVSQRLVARAQLSHGAGALALGTCHDGVIHVLDLLPAFRCHQ